MSDAPFKRRTAIWIAVVMAASFAAALLLAIFSDDFAVIRSYSANTYSRSAIGHRGLLELLQKLDVPVLVSEHASANKASGDALLIVAEPVIIEDQGVRAAALRHMVTESTTALVVLPKWYGLAHGTNPGWVGQVELFNAAELQPVLAALDLSGAIERPGAAVSWHSEVFAVPPTLASPQVLVSGDIEPIIASDHGVLLGLGVLDDQPYFVLSDPDLLSNHGLGRGDNARLAMDIIQHLRGHAHAVYTGSFEIADAPGAVIFDETMHGFQKEPSLWRALFEFPLALATMQALLVVALMLWSSLGRFGKPLPPRPAIAPGKGFLIDNTASLLRYGGHTDHVLARYLQTSIQDVSRALHAPHDMQPGALRPWLARIEAMRGIQHTLDMLERDVATAGAKERGRDRSVYIARRIYQWRQEMIHGSHHAQRH